MLTINEYQDRCKDTDLGNVGGRKNIEPEWMYYVLGIGGEFGELLEKIKKSFRDGSGFLSLEEKEAIIKEMGDVNWYMARLADKLGFRYERVFQMNIEKLQSRKDRKKLQGDGDNR